MKIFGFEFFKEDCTSKKLDTISNFLSTLSTNEQEKLFYKIFELVKDNPKIIYEYSIEDFYYPNLHPSLLKLFSKFKYLDINDIDKIGQKYVSEYFEEYAEENYNYIQIGYFTHHKKYVRYNSCFEYDEEIFDDTPNEPEKLNSDIFIFSKLNYLIMSILEEKAELENLKLNIKDKYVNILKQE